MNGHLMNNAGVQHYKHGNYTAARDNFRRAVADNPTNADYIHNLATSMKKQGDLAGAQQTYSQALALNPAHQPSYHSLAMLLNEQGRQAESLELLRGWAETQPYSPEPHVELAWAQRGMGDVSGAEQTLRNALRVDPSNHVAVAQLGQLYQNSGQSDRALAMYQRSLHMNWFQPQVQSRVAALGRSPSAVASRPLHTTPAVAFAPYQSPPARLSQYGTSQRVALTHPLPTFDNFVADSTFGTSGVVAAHPVQFSPPYANADPAHVPMVSQGIPEVQAH